MSRKALSAKDVELLRRVVDRHRPELSGLVDDLVSGRLLSVDEANDLRDALADELVQSGVDEELGAVNQRGKHIDLLIDRVAQRSALDSE